MTKQPTKQQKVTTPELKRTRNSYKKCRGYPGYFCFKSLRKDTRLDSNPGICRVCKVEKVRLALKLTRDKGRLAYRCKRCENPKLNRFEELNFSQYDPRSGEPVCFKCKTYIDALLGPFKVAKLTLLKSRRKQDRQIRA